MLLHQMAMDSDLLGQDMCSKWRKGEDVSHDFHWAQHFRVVPQHVQHSVGSVGGWDRGASEIGFTVLIQGANERSLVYY